MANAVTTQISKTIQDGVNQVSGLMRDEGDIISLIREDHKPLKELIAVMKDSERPLEERQEAFANFAPLLLTHAKAEEQSLYEFMKTIPDLREMAFEGDTEHSMADQLCEEIKRAIDPDDQGAKIKVLAESVEHHIQEEERDILPVVEQKTSSEDRVGLSDQYNQFEAEVIADGQDDAQPEADLEDEMTTH